MKHSVWITAVLCFLAQTVPAQGKIADGVSVPLKKVSLLTSGVGYFEHSGRVNGGVVIDLPFDLAAMNDALKSLTVRDPGGAGVRVGYFSENHAWKALEGLAVDLRGAPGIFDILRNLRGAAVTVTYAASQADGAPLSAAASAAASGVERTASGILLSVEESVLSLFTGGGVQVIRASDVLGAAFADPALNEDFRKALAIIGENERRASRLLSVSLQGKGLREVSLSYVIPAAVWKASYRLDLSSETPFLQGWSIIDNDSGRDWENVEITLVSGRPVSFVQQLYPPFHLFRPTKPLDIAGAAEGFAYDGAMMAEAGDEAVQYRLNRGGMETPAPEAAFADSAQRAQVFAAAKQPAVGQSAVDAAVTAADAGFLFEWTFKEPVTIARGQSLMLPFTESPVAARKVLVFNGQAAGVQGTHPQIGVELTNTTGQKLPPGPITVYDNGAYAGDALIRFFGAGEKRLLSYADDLSVTGSVSGSTRRLIATVKIAGGVMTLGRKTRYERVYSFNNASTEEKSVIIEHPALFNAALAVPEKADERTGSVYRFSQTLPAQRSVAFTVAEEIPASEQLNLAGMSLDNVIAYASNGEIPQRVRAALQQAVTLRQAVNAAQNTRDELERALERARTEQSRIRDNLTAAGADTEAGAQYLLRLREIDAQIDAINADYDAALAAFRAANEAYNDYIARLEL